MAENVYILGAGASRAAGAPLMKEFIDRAEDFFLARKFVTDEKRIGKVFEVIVELQRLYAKSSLDLLNIETLFGALEMGRIIKRLGKYTDENEIQQIRDSMILLIVRTIEKSISYDIQDGIPVPNDEYKNFAEMLSVKEFEPAAVITFNYDIALDYALCRWGKTINYNLTEVPGPGEINLLKLHGSTNWARAKDNNEICPYYIHRALNDYHFFGKRRATWEFGPMNKSMIIKHYQGRDFFELPVIVPPIWNKTEYQGSLTNVWAAAASALNSARNIYIFGYSLPESDAFFRYLFALGTMGDSRIRRFWVFDPDNTGRLEERFHNLLGEELRQRFRFFPLPFREAVVKLINERDQE
jgi:hypothetical protein